MKKEQSTVKKQVRKAHRTAKFVSALYLLGALALAGVACMPVLETYSFGQELWVLKFWKPFQDLISNWSVAEMRPLLFTRVLVALLYAFVLITAVVNFFKCWPCLSELSSKRNAKYVNGYNKSMEGMEKVGKLFSGTLASFLVFYLLIYMILPAGACALTMWTYVALGVGFGVHFIAGLLGGKISRFHTDGNVGELVEQKRSCSLLIYFIRNVLQVAVVAGIGYFLIKNLSLNAFVTTVFSFDNPFAGELMKDTLPFVLGVGVLVWLIVLINHATASTEFNYNGVHGAGMKVFRVFAFLIFLTAGGIFAVEYFVNKMDPVDYSYLIIACIAFVSFLIECFFVSVPKEKEMVDEDLDDIEMGVIHPTQPMQPMYPTCMNPAMQNAHQPIFIPVYYPFPIYTQPQPQAQQAPAPVALPAPALPAPKTETVEEPKKEKLILNPNKEWKVRCPRCGKELTVKETSPYHRCPKCDKVFQLQKYQAYKPNPNYNPKKK